MKYTLQASTLDAADLPLLAVGFPKHDKKPPAALAALDARSGGQSTVCTTHQLRRCANSWVSIPIPIWGR